MRKEIFVACLVLAGCGGDAARPPPSTSVVVPAPTTSSAPSRDDPAAASDADAGSTAGVSVANAEKVIAEIRPKFRSCYNRALADDPSVVGSTMFAVDVGADGHVTNVAIAQSTGLPADLNLCMQEALSKAEFEAPPRGHARINVPVRFERKR